MTEAQKKFFDDMTEEQAEFFGAVLEELVRAEDKHKGWPDDAVHASAILNEEAGKLTQASIDYVYSGQADEPYERMKKDPSVWLLWLCGIGTVWAPINGETAPPSPVGVVYGRVAPAVLMSQAKEYTKSINTLQAPHGRTA